MRGRGKKKKKKDDWAKNLKEKKMGQQSKCVYVCVFVFVAIKGLVMWFVSKVWIDMSGSHSERHFDGNHENKEFFSVEE